MNNKMMAALVAVLVIAMGFQMVWVLQLENRLNRLSLPADQAGEVLMQTPKKMPYLRGA